MIIIKTSDPKYSQSNATVPENDLTRIAQYAINFMAGIKLYKNGVFDVNATEKFPTIKGKFDMFVKASKGVIVVPPNINLNVFERKVLDAIEGLEKRDLVGTQHEDYLKKYHSVSNNVYTTLKLKSAQKLTECSSKPDKKNVRIHTMRIQHMGSSDISSRFVWYIIKSTEFDFDIINRQRETCFLRHVLSIFYDPSDSLHHADDTFINTLKISDSRLIGKIIKNVEILPSYTNNVLLVELNGRMQRNKILTKKKKKSNPDDFMYKTISGCNRFEEKNFNSLCGEHYIIIQGELTPDKKQVMPKMKDNGSIVINITPTDVSGSMSYNICSCCKEKLYDDNYIAVHETQDTTSAKPLCPACGHFSNSTAYSYLIRVTYDVSIIDKISSMKYSFEKKNILIDIFENGVKKYNDSILLLGKRYIGVFDIYEHLLSPPNMDLNDRSIVLIPRNLDFDYFKE